jgi:microcystin-dependent protein
MPYNVEFTDKNNKSPITVFDNTSSTDTSLIFPGRNVTGYGQIIAENFLHLLENFASSTEPVNPVEGQLWYDSTNGVLQIWDNVSWKAASGIQKGPTEPSVTTAKVGELWIDTTNQQLRIFTGTRWILVGPSESSIDGLRYGPSVEKIVDSDNVDRYVLIFYLKDVPVILFSKDSFVPKISISGFTLIKAGLNVTVPITSTEIAQFEGGNLPKLVGTAQSSDALNISGVAVDAGKFLRTDTVNTTEFPINIRNNSGITLGSDGTFIISSSTTAAKIYNSASGSSIDLQVNRNGVPSTTLRVINDKVGINTAAPDYELQVTGSIAASDSLFVLGTAESTNLSNGSVRINGGASIKKNLLIGTGLDVTGVTQTNEIQPKTTDTYDNGTSTKRWKTVRAKTIIADEIQGVLTGNIAGNSNTATSLKNVTTFQLAGDVISPAVSFDGQVGSYTKIFNTTLTANIISDKDEPFPKVSRNTDFVLTYRPSEAATASLGLLKQTRDTFVGDLGVPIGAILPFAGSTVPSGYLLCDGSEVERVKFPTLWDVVGFTYSKTRFLAIDMTVGQTYTIESLGTIDFALYGLDPITSAPVINSVGETFVCILVPTSGTGSVFTTNFNGIGTFRLPDLRGRFPLGKDNMDNAGTVPNSSGGYVDAGGGNVDRVPDTKADILGEGAGSSDVSLALANIPDHQHSLGVGSTQYNTVKVGTGQYSQLGTTPSAVQISGTSGTNISNTTGSIDTTSSLGTAIGIMNPYLTINFIIRSGPPVF